MWQRILSAEGLWTCPFVTETSMYLSAALQLAKQRHAPSTTFHNQKGKSYQKLTLHQFAYHILQLFWKTVLLKSWKQKTRLLPASTSWFFQQLWDIFNLIIWDPVSSYFILSSYFQDVWQCFCTFFVGHSCFDAGFVECETERFRLPRCCGFLSKHVKTRHHISERWGIDCIISLLLLLHHYVLKHDLNIFKHCVDNHIP